MTAPDPRYTRERLEEAVLGGVPRLTSQDVAQAAGVGIEDARRLWRALGFPETGDAAAFTDGDLEALGRIFALVAADVVDLDTAVRLTRAVGQTMAKLADWQVGTLSSRVEELESGSEATGSRIGSALRLTDAVTPPFEHLLIYAWRRHLAAAVGRVEALGANDEDLHTVEVAVGFADLVAFTALSNQLGEDRIGDLVEVFESRCADVVAAHSGRVVKTLGDSVLFIVEDAPCAMDVGLSIVSVIGGDPQLPDVRVGIATGSVVLRLGDVYGPPVNLASRLTAVARRNRLLTDPRTAALLGDEFVTQALPARPLRGFGVVEPVAVRRA